MSLNLWAAFGIGLILGSFVNVLVHRLPRMVMASFEPASTTTCTPVGVGTIIVCRHLADSRIGRAWMAIREDEIAAKAMGINTRNMKLLAFGMGASFGGI